MSEVEKSVEETLAEAAQATKANSEAKPKKERVKKASGGEGAASGGEKPAKEPKAPKEKKLYPQANEDGTAALDGEGNPVMGPYATRYKEPKAPKTPRAPRVTKFTLSLNGAETSIKEIQNDAVIHIVGNVGSREGSKRAGRAAAFKEGITVAQFFTDGGVPKDLNRHLKSGAVTLEVAGAAVVVVPTVAAPEAPAE